MPNRGFEHIEFIMTGVSNREHSHSKTRRHEALAGKRIALFTGAYNYISDGVTLTLNRLVTYLERHGAEALIFSPTTKNPPSIKHAGTLVSVPSIPFPGRSDYRLAVGLPRKARTRLKAFAPDLIHIATPDYMGSKALRWARAQEIPVVTSFHTHFGAYMKYFVSYHKYYRMDLLESTAWRYGRWFYPQCEHIYVPTRSIADELRSHGITNGLRLWPRGVDTSFFNPSKRSVGWRQTLGIKDDELVVAFVSRLVWEKGLHVFADVVEGLKARGLRHRSMIVGEGPARAKLEERLPNTVFTGHLRGDTLARAYASADVFLFPSDTETFGNVTLEAMASGLPTVCADAPGSSALVNDGETGFLAQPGDAAGFLKAVERLVTDPALRRAMGEQALARARTYEWEEAMARIAGYYEEIFEPQPVTDTVEGDGHPASDLGISPPVLIPPSSV